MAGDAAKVLRIKPDAIASLPKGPGIARAQNLAKLSDDAFDLYINRVIDERFAEQIGHMVDDPTMHLPIARLIERVKPETTEQARSVISQAMEAPVSREKTADLFGETEVVQSLYLEQAKVLERSMQIMREDRTVFKTLTEQTERIEGSGANKLDKATNAEIRQQVETALAAIKSLAHRAGPISEALRNGAKSYKETGRLKEAAQSVAAAVRREVQRNGLDGLAAGPSGRATKPVVAGKTTLDPNAEFADPLGQAAKDQVEATRIDVPDVKDGGAWVVVNRKTSEYVLETSNPAKVAALKGDFIAVPSREYLEILNARVKEAGGEQPNPQPWVTKAKTEKTPAGQQTMIEGVDPITPRDRLEAAQDKPMDGGVADNDTQIGGLFDPNDPSRFDLFDAVPMQRGFDADGKEIAITKTREEVVAELDADDNFVAQLEVCL